MAFCLPWLEETRSQPEKQVKAYSILYHDVVAANELDSSGFRGPEAARYKLTEERFREHLREIAKAVRTKPATAQEFLDATRTAKSWLLHFDDGGVSAVDTIASVLDEYNWKGHFYVPTDFIGRPGFLHTDDIRSLWKQSHIIGSHSCSHPAKISRLPSGELVEEWRKSKEILSDILGDEVAIASIPGGFYSRRVARAASAAGIRILFTSEPVATPRRVEGCLVFGRYSIVDRTPARIAAALVTNGSSARLWQCLYWNFKKAAKVTLGPVYAAARSYSLRRKRCT
jgi:peptidoglycan/xylan/chitin deacetylase (PgdA/CDA1 family)